MGNRDTRVTKGEWGQRQASGTLAKNIGLKKRNSLTMEIKDETSTTGIKIGSLQQSKNPETIELQLSKL